MPERPNRYHAGSSSHSNAKAFISFFPYQRKDQKFTWEYEFGCVDICTSSALLEPGPIGNFLVNFIMNYVHLRSFDNYVNANIQLGMLQDAGINCHLQDEYTITIDPLLNYAIGGMKLMVYETQVPRAMQLLSSTEEPAGEGSQHQESEDAAGQAGQAAPGILQKLGDILTKYMHRGSPGSY
jgi:hypothetical protein